MSEILVRIEAPHFVAGLVACDGTVVTAAPIIRYMTSWDGRAVADFCRRKRWAWAVLKTDDQRKE